MHPLQICLQRQQIVDLLSNIDSVVPSIIYLADAVHDRLDPS
jgi:hypothetical protein